ncbi:amino acid transporter [Podospora conica]|nr:amino acid transporter [Schizothecium conicum]
MPHSGAHSPPALTVSSETPLLAEHQSATPGRDGDDSDAQDAAVDKTCQRSLSFWDGVALTLGIQIGSGIFISPALVARYSSSTLSALLIWVVGGVLAWACAACYIELGTRLPFNGGPQEYLAHCFGDLLGFITSWVCIFGIKPCSAAILALFIADYVCGSAAISPAAAGGGAAGWDRVTVALLVVTLVTVVNCTGNRLSNISTKVLLACKVIGVGFIIIVGFAVLVFPSLGAAEPNDPSIVPPDVPVYSTSYVDALVAAMWAYSGWEVLSFVGGDLRNPARNFPRVINAAMAIVLLFTLFANVAYFSALGFDAVAQSTTVGLTFSQKFLGRAGSVAYAVAICLSSLGTLNVKTFAAGRLTQAAAERGYLPMVMKTVADDADEENVVDVDPLMGAVEGRTMFDVFYQPVKAGDGSVPLSAIVFNSLLTAAFVLAGDISFLIAFMGIIEYTVVFLSLIGLLSLRIRGSSTTGNGAASEAVIKVPTALIPVALATVGWMVLFSTIRHPEAGLGFFLCCALGAAIHTIIIRPRRRVPS